jgi:hypothetical protein
MVPSAKLGIAILSNADSTPALNALKYRLLDQYLGLPPTDWIAAVDQVAREAAEHAKKEAPARRTSPAAPPSLPLAAYDGVYRDAWYGDATIKTSAARTVLSLSRTPDMTGDLSHVDRDTFKVRWRERSLNADAFVRFTLKPDGTISTMNMAPVSEETDSSFDFGDLSFVPQR